MLHNVKCLISQTFSLLCCSIPISSFFLRYSTLKHGVVSVAMGTSNSASQTLICLQITWRSWENADLDSLGLGWSLRFCISSKHPGDAASAAPWTMLGLAKLQSRGPHPADPVSLSPGGIWQHLEIFLIIMTWWGSYCWHLLS